MAHSAISTIRSAPETRRSALPRWAAYPLTVFMLTLLAGLAGWMMQRGIRRWPALLMTLGVSAAMTSLVLRAGGIQRGKRALPLISGVVFLAGFIDAVRTSKQPTLP